ncbi:complement C1q-like protein 4 [Engraulis encrasicolus]|uniref:complement C1q-like protein 4 n=1 Tax=Engraulis encrasicolus TaxID=184585 RepID=UPI002FD78FEA
MTLKVTLKMRASISLLVLLVLFSMSGAETPVKSNEIESACHGIGTALATVSAKLNALEQEVAALREIKATPKVAFSAFLPIAGFLRAGHNHMNLVFSQVNTNVGNAYSSTTGFFTAPVRGVYYFRFTVVDKLNGHWMAGWLFKNGQFVIRLYEWDTDGEVTNVSSGVALELEEGDTVNMVLPAGFRLWDNKDNRNTFSGFLIFPL